MDKSLMTGSTTMLVLALLKKSDKYGYEMISELEKQSNHVFVLKEGTLYPLLHGMENKGLVKSYMAEGETKRKRKYYSITKRGLKHLKDKQKEWELFSSKVNKVIGGDAHAYS